MMIIQVYKSFYDSIRNSSSDLRLDISSSLIFQQASSKFCVTKTNLLQTQSVVLMIREGVIIHHYSLSIYNSEEGKNANSVIPEFEKWVDLQRLPIFWFVFSCERLHHGCSVQKRILGYGFNSVTHNFSLRLLSPGSVRFFFRFFILVFVYFFQP